MSTKHTPLSIVAAVQMTGGGEALVLNRPISLVYERVGKDFIGSDGPFKDHLVYERGSGRFVAFAGRELQLRMADGSIERVKDHWWHSTPAGFRSIGIGSVAELQKCYVFCAANIAIEALADLRSGYTGCVYPYWDYEKVIKYDSLRRDLWGRVFHNERRCKRLIEEVKSKHRELLAARAAIAATTGEQA